MASNGAICLSKIHYLRLSSGILKQEENIWEDRKDYIRWTNIAFELQRMQKDKAYPVELEYTCNRQSYK